MSNAPPQGRGKTSRRGRPDAPDDERADGRSTPDEIPSATRRAIKDRSLMPLAIEAATRTKKPLVPIVDEAKEKLKPLAHVAAAIGGVGSIAAQLAQTPGSTGPMALATVVVGPLAWRFGRRTIEQMMITETPARIQRARRFASLVATATAGWMTSAAAFGVDHHTGGGAANLTLGGLIALWAASPYVRFRNQPPPVVSFYTDPSDSDPDPGQDPDPEEQEEEVPPLGFAVLAAQNRAIWAERCAPRDGVLPGTSLSEDTMREIKGGWTATIVSDVPGSFDPGRFVPATGRVAAAFQVGISDVTIEVNSADSSQANLTMLHDNPLTSFQAWAGPYALLGEEEMKSFDPETGVAVIGVHSDGDLVRYRFWNAGGAWHDLISGATGSGKSEFVSLLLAYERHAVVEVPVLDDNQQPVIDDETGKPKMVKKGLVVSRVGDPQWGQSFGDWQEHVDWFCPTIDEIRIMLQKTEREMYARNMKFGQTRWYDERTKRWRKGIKNFPLSPDMPLIVITIDEAHEVLKDPECKRIVAVLGKMGRKTGIKLRLITQVPLLQELGNDMAIRDAVASGNVLVFRTANSLSGQVAFNGALPAQPNQIPREWPKGRAKPGEEMTSGIGYALGPSARPVIMRTFYLGDIIDWIYQNDQEWGVPGELDPDTRAAGTGYEDRKQRLADLEGLTEVPESSINNARRGTSMTGEQAVLEAFLTKSTDEYKIKLEDLIAFGLPIGSRQVSNVLTKMVGKGWMVAGAKGGQLPFGWYQLTQKGREEGPDELSQDNVVEDPAGDEVKRLIKA